MDNFARVGRRIRGLKVIGFLFAAVGMVILACAWADFLIGYARGVAWPRAIDEVIIFSLFACGFFAVAGLLYSLARRFPSHYILLLAKARNGFVSLPDVATSLAIDPVFAAKALKHLQKLQICAPRWQEYRKNLWEFPDYVHLPLDQAFEIAKNTGRVTLKDLLAQGHSLDTAMQTLDTLSREGVPAHAEGAVPVREGSPVAAAQ